MYLYIHKSADMLKKIVATPPPTTQSMAKQE